MTNQRTVLGLLTAIVHPIKGISGPCVIMERWTNRFVRWSMSGSQLPTTSPVTIISRLIRFLILCCC